MTATTSTKNRQLFLNADVGRGIGIGAAATALSYVIGSALGWTDQVHALEAFAVFTSYVCTYLCVKQRRVNYIVGATSTIAYCLLFWQQDLYASMVLNLYLTPMLLYGWIRWRADSDPRPVTRVEPRWALVYALATGVAFGGAVAATSAVGGSFPLGDSVILVGSILAQLLLDNKKVETWIVWLIVDVVAVWVYVSAGLAIAGIQYAFFIANAVWGFVAWRRSMAWRTAS
jgi:nicotinamide mononucleotide transporter